MTGIEYIAAAGYSAVVAYLTVVATVVVVRLWAAQTAAVAAQVTRLAATPLVAVPAPVTLPPRRRHARRHFRRAA